MKENPLLASIPKRVVDNTALTTEEIITSRGLSQHGFEEIRDMNLLSGAWEQVWKKSGVRLVKAYRLAKKPRK